MLNHSVPQLTAGPQPVEDKAGPWPISTQGSEPHTGRPAEALLVSQQEVLHL